MKKSMLAALLVIAATLTAPLFVGAWTLAWDASTGTVEGYIVEISTDEGLSWDYLYTVMAPETTLPLDGICQFNTGYQFRVSAFNAAGMSEPCPPLSWTRPPFKAPPDKPLPPVNGGTLPGNVTAVQVD